MRYLLDPLLMVGDLVQAHVDYRRTVVRISHRVAKFEHRSDDLDQALALVVGQRHKKHRAQC
jgi:hypothetical protein